MRKTFKSKFTPRNPLKYHGDVDKITCRSSPERAICRYFDLNLNVVKWSSETHIVPYICATDGQWHRYYVDFYALLRNGEQLLIEYKPGSQTTPPTPPKKKTPKALMSYQNALNVYLKNQSKWKYATEYAKSKGMRFQVWSERHLEAIGIRFV